MTASRFGATIILSAGICLAVFEADGQAAARIARVGYLSTSAPVAPDSFAEELRTRGWVEGQNVIIERRYTEGDVERAPRLADFIASNGIPDW